MDGIPPEHFDESRRTLDANIEKFKDKFFSGGEIFYNVLTSDMYDYFVRGPVSQDMQAWYNEHALAESMGSKGRTAPRALCVSPLSPPQDDPRMIRLATLWEADAFRRLSEDFAAAVELRSSMRYPVCRTPVIFGIGFSDNLFGDYNERWLRQHERNAAKIFSSVHQEVPPGFRVVRETNHLRITSTGTVQSAFDIASTIEIMEEWKMDAYRQIEESSESGTESDCMFSVNGVPVAPEEATGLFQCPSVTLPTKRDVYKLFGCTAAERERSSEVFTPWLNGYRAFVNQASGINEGDADEQRIRNYEGFKAICTASAELEIDGDKIIERRDSLFFHWLPLYMLRSRCCVVENEAAILLIGKHWCLCTLYFSPLHAPKPRPGHSVGVAVFTRDVQEEARGVKWKPERHGHAAVVAVSVDEGGRYTGNYYDPNGTVGPNRAMSSALTDAFKKVYPGIIVHLHSYDSPHEGFAPPWTIGLQRIFPCQRREYYHRTESDVEEGLCSLLANLRLFSLVACNDEAGRCEMKLYREFTQLKMIKGGMRALLDGKPMHYADGKEAAFFSQVWKWDQTYYQLHTAMTKGLIGPDITFMPDDNWAGVFRHCGETAIRCVELFHDLKSGRMGTQMLEKYWFLKSSKTPGAAAIATEAPAPAAAAAAAGISSAGGASAPKKRARSVQSPRSVADLVPLKKPAAASKTP